MVNEKMLLPNQAVSYKKKAADGFKLMKESAAYYMAMAKFGEDLLPLYRYANGSYIDTRLNGRYKKLLNPLGLSNNNERERKLLAKGKAVELKNFPIITPIISKFMGEMRMRSMDYIVEAINADVVSVRTEKLKEMMNAYTDQMMFNALNAAGVESGMPTQEQQPVEEVIKTFNMSYVDERAVIGQQALNIIAEECALLKKRMTLFMDWITAGYVFSYKTVEKDTIVSEVVAPPDFWYMDSPDIMFVEDTEAQVRRLTRFPVEKLLQKFPELSKKDVEHIENHYGIAYARGKFVSGDVHTGFVSGRTSDQEAAGHHTTLYHIVWRSMRYQGTLRYYDELGEEQLAFVDEDYVLDVSRGDIEIVDDWVDEYWECYQYMPDKFTTPKPLDVQRNSFAGKAKSCYNGRAFSNRFAENMSIVKLGEDFQQEVNEIRYRVARTLSKNKDNPILIDISVIPNSATFNRDDFMYFMEEFGVAFIDRSQKGADRSFNQYTVLQASQMEAVFRGYELMMTWRGFYWDLVGMNPQRLGQVGTSAGKGVTQEAVQASSEISEEHFARFEEFEETEMQGYIDLSKFAWKHGKQAMYKRGDDAATFFQIDGSDYQEMEHRIVAKSSGKEKMKVQLFKEMLLPIIQNSGQQGVKSSMIASLLDMDSMSEIKKLAKNFDEAEAKAMQEQQQAQHENAMQLQQAQQEFQQGRDDFELLKQEREHNNKITLKMMDVETRDTAFSGVDTPVDIAAIDANAAKLHDTQTKKYIEERKAMIAEEKVRSDERIKSMENDTKRYVSDNQLKVAKENKNKHDRK